MFKEPIFSGVYASLVTPFDADEGVDESALRKLISRMVGEVDGLVVCGAEGEFEYLSDTERRRVIAVAVDEVAGRVPLIVGTGSASTRLACQLSSFAEEAGADAVIVSTPYFLFPADKGYHQHFLEVSNSTSLPMIVYNPMETCIGRIPRKVLEDISYLDNVVALADSSGDMPYLMEVIEKVKGRMDVLVSNEETVYPSLCVGCSGMILGSAQVYPSLWRGMFNSFADGDDDQSRILQARVQKLSRLFMRHGLAVPLKAALRMIGEPVGKARGPLKEGGSLLHEDREEIKVELERIGMLERAGQSVTEYDMPLNERFSDIGISPADIQSHGVRLSSASHGSGEERAVIDIALGRKDGLLGDVFASQLVYLDHGKESLPIVLEPNLATLPPCLIIPVMELRSMRQANMVYGPAQGAIAKAIVDLCAEGMVPQRVMDECIMLARVFMDPNALDRSSIYVNFHQATRKAMEELLKEVPQ